MNNNYEIASKPDILFQGEQREFESKELEIRLGDRGIPIEGLSDFIIDENLVTPATRTKVLEELRNFGILIQRQDRYVIDKRGLMMYAVDEFYSGERVSENRKGIPFERSHSLKSEINETESISEIDLIGLKFDMLSNRDKIELKAYLKKWVPELLEIEEDLVELDSF